MMKNFAPEFQTPEQYIIDITYKIWEERGVNRIRDWYAAKGPVRTPHGVTESAESVVQYTLQTMHEFPDRELLAEDVIIGHTAEGFLSSHRVRSTATHLGHGAFGPATHRPITSLTIADCLCRDNHIVEEWLLRDQAAIARQLGLDPVTFGRALGSKNPEAYTIGLEAMHRRWAAPDGPAVLGDDDGLAERIIQTYDALWNDKALHVMAERYDRALRFEGPSGYLCYGRLRTGNFLTGILASIPNGQFAPHNIVVRRETEKATRISLRWSYCGPHSGQGRYGQPTNVPLAVLGISHFELRDGLIVNEWMVVDETAIYAQIAAHEKSQRQD